MPALPGADSEVVEKAVGNLDTTAGQRTELLDERVERLATHLTQHLGTIKAFRYRLQITQVSSAEHRQGDLTTTVADALHRLMAVNDGYEMVRLQTSSRASTRVLPTTSGSDTIWLCPT